jgi:hypothetical protein
LKHLKAITGYGIQACKPRAAYEAGSSELWCPLNRHALAMRRSSHRTRGARLVRLARELTQMVGGAARVVDELGEERDGVVQQQVRGGVLGEAARLWKTRPFQPASLFPRSQLAEAGRPSELPRAHPLALANPARRDSGRTLVAGVFPQVPHVLPASKSMISVESMTVCSRWAMVSTVHSSKALRMAVCSTASVSLSMEAW